MDQQKCIYCGKPIYEGLRFCGYCGREIRKPQNIYPKNTTELRTQTFDGVFFGNDNETVDNAYDDDDQAPVYDDYEESYAPFEESFDESDFAQDVPEKAKKNKFLIFVLSVLIVVFVVEGLFATLYFLDITTSFFPKEEIVSLFSGESTKTEQPESPQNLDELTTKALPYPENLQPYFQDATVVNKDYRIKTSDNSLRMRYLPTTNSDILTDVPSGTIVRVLFTYNGWGYYEFNNHKGWSSMQYLVEF